MSTDEGMAGLVTLWSLIQEVQLLPGDDVISWCWTSNGVYTPKSAYDIQFRGSYCSCNSTAIWKSKVEGKHRFFAWLLLQCKWLTVDKLLLRNWSCNPQCPFCDQLPEMVVHLCLHCAFAQ